MPGRVREALRRRRGVRASFQRGVERKSEVLIGSVELRE
jgi:hypothetical protein